MIVRLSTKGQLVIPRRFREQLGLEAGTQFDVQVRTGQIILTPLTHKPLAELYGKYKGTNLLDALEADHRQALNEEGKAPHSEGDNTRTPHRQMGISANGLISE